MTTFATRADYASCEKLHRKFGTTYYFASQWFPQEVRLQVHSVYGFVRVPDEWVDNPGDLSKAEQLALLRDWRSQLLEGIRGIVPKSGVMRAFVDTVKQANIPIEEPLAFLDAMEMDLSRTTYPTYQDLQTYMRGSASAVGVMMLYVMQTNARASMVQAAKDLGEAMQLTNFLRDVGEDLVRDRVYLPLADMQMYGVSVADLGKGIVTEAFVNLMKFEIERARVLFASSDAAIRQLNPTCQRSVLLARILYSRILDVIEVNQYDVFTKRARTSGWEKLVTAMNVITDPTRALVHESRRT